jgi:hypothetical protein
MAHWAEIDENNVVLRVLVTSNDDPNGDEGKKTLEEGLGGTWVQTSYNRNFRKNFAGIGHTYDPDRDAFIPPKPFDSWVLNEDTCQWESPVPMPEPTKPHQWDEEAQSWNAVEHPLPDGWYLDEDGKPQAPHLPEDNGNLWRWIPETHSWEDTGMTRQEMWPQFPDEPTPPTDLPAV